MSKSRILTLLVPAVLALAGVAAVAQEKPSATPPIATESATVATGAVPASPVDRAAELQRLGLAEDPGPAPDSARVFIRNGRKYRIEKVVKDLTAPPKKKGEGWIQPNHHVNMELEIYRMDDQFVWFFAPVPEKKRPVAKYRVDANGKKIKVRDYSAEEIEMFRQLRDEFELFEPPAGKVVVALAEASEGLPRSGSWRNSLTLVDLDKDGRVEIVAPPQRSAVNGFPSIFSRSASGAWTEWQDASWPFAFTYGAVESADLNADGKLDLVFAVHLRGVLAFLGDGKGAFSDASAGLPSDFPTRRVRLADLDHDGDMDILAISEGPAKGGPGPQSRGSKLRGFLNDGVASKWTPIEIAPAERQLSGDWLHTGDVNGDGKLDIVGASTQMSGTDLVYLGTGNKTWVPFGRGELPWYSVYLALATGKFSDRTRDDVVLSYFREWPSDIDPDMVVYPASRTIVGIERLTWKKGKPARLPVARWFSTVGLWALASGDLDSDGHLDIVYLNEPKLRLEYLRGDGKGGFERATLAGIKIEPKRVYDLVVRDIDGDAKDDLVIMYEADESVSNGSIQVWLNRGAVNAD